MLSNFHHNKECIPKPEGKAQRPIPAEQGASPKKRHKNSMLGSHALVNVLLPTPNVLLHKFNNFS